MTKRIFGIIIFFALSTVAIISLYYVSQRKIYKKGGFQRLINSQKLKLLEAYDLKNNSYYIAGLDDKNIYLGNQQITSQILILSDDFKEIKKVNINTRPYQISWAGAKITIDSPNVFITEHITPSILHGNWHPFSIVPDEIKNVNFSEALPISSSTFILKSYDQELRRDILLKKQLKQPKIIFGKSILEKQIDGRFCEDGMLLGSPDRFIVYVYYYRNQFICVDTNLNVIYKQHTIDTNNFAKIKVEKIISRNAITISTPQEYVNKRAFVSKYYIFINSTQLSENEEKGRYFKSSVIDVYALNNGQYKFSFYVPDMNHSKVVSFRVFGDRFIATYENHYIAVFKIMFKINEV